MSSKENYGFNVWDRVCHIRDPELKGICTEIDEDCDLGDVTTCRVAWGASSIEEAQATPREDTDIQWTNKLALAK